MNQIIINIRSILSNTSLLKSQLLAMPILFIFLVSNFDAEINAQCAASNAPIGSIKLKMKLTKLSSANGMHDFDQGTYTSPDLYYLAKNMSISTPAWTYTLSDADHYFPNQSSGKTHIVDDTFFDGFIIMSFFNGSFGLHNSNALNVNFRLQGHEEDAPFNVSQYTPEDDNGYFISGTLPFTAFANNGAASSEFRRSIQWIDHPVTQIEFPYHFTFTSSYELDALMPTLQLSDAIGNPRSEYCVGEELQITASYKQPFCNGRFEWQRKIGNGNWVTINGYTSSNSIRDVVRAEPTIYRTRLVPDHFTYGVHNYEGQSVAISTAPNIRPSIADIAFETEGACTLGSNGNIKITNIAGIPDGSNVRVIINEFDFGDEIEIASFTINGYDSNYLSSNEVSFDTIPGNYSVRVEYTDGIPCSRTEYFSILQLTNPEFTFATNIPLCFGGNGTIEFNNISTVQPQGPWNYSLMARNIITDSTYRTDGVNTTYGKVLAPAGQYVLSVLNQGICIWEHPDTAEVYEQFPIAASIADVPTYELNGNNYHGLCSNDLFESKLTVAGGTPPYSVFVYNSAGSYSRDIVNDTITLSNLSHGSNNYTITDKEGCTFAGTPFMINNPPAVQFGNLNISDPTQGCGMVNNDGIISFVPAGGIAPYTIYYNGQEVSEVNHTTLGTTTADLRIVDDHACVANTTASISDPLLLTVSDHGELMNTSIPCNGNKMITIYVDNMASDNQPYPFYINGVRCDNDPNCQETQVSWDYGSPYTFVYNYKYDIVVQSEGVHTYTMTDAACTVSASYQFEFAEDPEVTNYSTSAPDCAGDPYQVTFYLDNIIPDNAGVYAPVNYTLDGVAGSANLLMDMTGEPMLPFQFTLPVNEGMAHEITLNEAVVCGNATPLVFDLAPIATFDLTIGTITDAQCNGSASGNIAFTMTEGAPYNVDLFINDPMTSTYVKIDSVVLANANYSFGNLEAGNYRIESRNIGNCLAFQENIIVGVPSEITGTLSTASQINCTGKNGTIEVINVSGGTGPYMYSLNNGAFQNSAVLNGAELENTVMIRDANGCFEILTLSIPEAGATLFSSSQEIEVATECALGQTEITLQAGFTHPVTIQLVDDPNNFFLPELTQFGDSLVNQMYTDTLTDLEVGQHYIVIRDGLGCVKIDSFTTTLGAALVAAVDSKTRETCYQQSTDGSFSITASGGRAPYTVSLNGGTEQSFSSSYTFSNLEFGTYNFVINDFAGCSVSFQDSILTENLPQLTSTTGNFLGCVGDNFTAEVTLTGVNGTGPYSFTWLDGSTDNPRTGVAAGEYNVTVSDANGCTSQSSVNVFETDSLVLTLVSTQDNVCQADQNGTITVNATGGFPPYQFSKDGGATYQTSSTLTGLSIGTIEVIVKDSHDCTSSTSGTISYTNPLTASVAVSNATCQGANDGTLTITVSNGVGPYTYSKDGINFQAANIFSNLTPGTYEAWVEDGSGCKAVYFGNEITEPTVISVSTSLTNDEACGQMNGAVSGMASGGTPPLVFEWNGNPALNTASLNNIAAGTQTLKITDANGCIMTSDVLVSNISAPSLSLSNSQDEICGNANGSIALTVSDGVGPFTYAWSHNAGLNLSNANNLVAGNYSCTVTDANNCTDIFNTAITEISGPSLSVLAANNSLCTNDNGSIEVVPSDGTGPFTYSWSHNAMLNSSAANNLSSGNYTVTITDANGCSNELSQAIEFFDPPSFDTPIVNSEICGNSNGQIDLTVNNGQGALNYDWSHDVNLTGAQANNLPNGDYSVTVTDALGCSAELLNITVGEIAAPDLSIASFVNTDCLNPAGAITVAASNGTGMYSFAWSHDASINSESASGLLSGTYTITVTDDNACTAVVSQSLISFVGESQVTNTLDCFGDSDGAIAISLEGNVNDYQYQWSEANLTGTTTATNLSAGEYSVTVTNDNGCTEVFTETIESPDEVMINIDGIIPVGCQGNLGSATAVTTGGTGNYNYAWNDVMNQTEATAMNLPIGNYTVEATDANNCSNTQTVSIEQSVPISLQEGTAVEPNCAGDDNGSLEVLASGGFGILTYEWNTSDDQTTAVDLAAGEYTVTVTDEVACTNELIITLDEPDVLVSTAALEQAILCFGDANGSLIVAVEGGTMPYFYEWSDTEVQTTVVASQLSSGEYVVEVTDANGCETSAEVTLGEPELLTLALEVDNGPCSELPSGSIAAFASGGNGGYVYNWSNGGSEANIDELASGSYELTVVDQEGCTAIENEVVENLAVDFIGLGQSDTLVCNGDLIHYDFSASEFETFEWSSQAEGVVGQESNFTIFESGTYYLSATNDIGCEVKDTMSVTHFAGNLDAFFIAPTDIVKGDTLVAVELTLPIPDEVDWIYDSNVITLLGQDENQFLFSFAEAGTFDLQMNARLGGCSNQITKTIFVYETEEDVPFVNPLVPSILELTVFPNPNDGQFQMEIELSTEMDMVIDFYDAQSVLYDRSQFSGGKSYVKEYDLDLGPGIYYAVVRVAGSRKSVTIVVE